MQLDMDTLTVMSADPETRAEYNARIKELNDIYAGNASSYKKGKEEGLEEGKKLGLEKGEKKAKLETAKKLLSMGLSIEQVVQGTGLSLEEVKQL